MSSLKKHKLHKTALFSKLFQIMDITHPKEFEERLIQYSAFYDYMKNQEKDK